MKHVVIANVDPNVCLLENAAFRRDAALKRKKLLLALALTVNAHHVSLEDPAARQKKSTTRLVEIANAGLNVCLLENAASRRDVASLVLNKRHVLASVEPIANVAANATLKDNAAHKQANEVLFERLGIFQIS